MHRSLTRFRRWAILLFLSRIPLFHPSRGLVSSLSLNRNFRPLYLTILKNNPPNVTNIKRISTNQRKLSRLNAPTLASVGSLALTPVNISVNTFWGEQSQFNFEFKVKGSLENTPRDVKELVFRKTGIPTRIQDLYIMPSKADNPAGDLQRKGEAQSSVHQGPQKVSLDGCVKFEGDRKLSEFHKGFMFSKGNELQVRMLLNLPVPIYGNLDPTPSNLGEYMASLSRYSSLLKSLDASEGGEGKAASGGGNKESKEAFRDAQENIRSFIRESQLPRTEAAAETGPDKGKERVRLSRVYMRPFQDLPPESHLLTDRFKSLFDFYLPMNVKESAKIILFSVFFNLSKRSTFFRTLPVVTLFVQTRPGKFLYKFLAHFLSHQHVPKCLYNLLPAHLAEKIRSS